MSAVSPALTRTVSDPLIAAAAFNTFYDTGIPSKLGGGHFNYMVRMDEHEHLQQKQPGFACCQQLPDAEEGKAAAAAAAATLGNPLKHPRCFTTVSVNEVSDIDPSARSYSARIRLYLVWHPALNSETARALFARHLASAKEAARSRGEPLTLTPDEYATAASCWTLPELVFPDASEVEELDAPRLKVFPGKWLLWTRAYHVCHVAEYNLHHFPYDVHPLPLKLAQLSDKVNFKITVAQAQYAKAVLAMPEWSALRPSAAEVNKGKGAYVYINVKRNSAYYNKNVFAVIFALTCTSFSVYTFGPNSTSDRVNTILALLLTTVAFKLGISDSLPKLGYDTLLDRYLALNMAFLFLQVAFSIVFRLFSKAPPFAKLEASDGDGGNTTMTDASGEASAGILDLRDLNMVLCLTSMCIYLVLNAVWLVCTGDRRAKTYLTFKKKTGRGFYSSTFCTGLRFLDYAKTDTDENLGNVFFNTKKKEAK